jgi:hypothetical protein
MLPKHLERNTDELERIRELIASGHDRPVLMINENAYTATSGYPDAEPYKSYILGLDALVRRVGGAILWRVPVLGQPVGSSDRVDEILGIWYPGHQAYLDVATAEGSVRSYELRTLCVERALIHRCDGAALQPDVSMASGRGDGSG